MTGPLAGLHVVEFANEISGPYAAKLFVDLGAEVTKIEPPAGDALRRWGPFPGGVADPERSGLFHYLNAGKRGATLDLAQPDDLAAARELIARAHVLIEDFVPGTLEGLGLGPDALSRLNPNLVLLRISHFGQCGPWRRRRATPLTVQAASGWISARDPDRPPVQVGARISEYVAGVYGALGALTALRLPPAGRVREVDVSQLEALLSTLPYPMLMARRMQHLGLPANLRSAPMLGVVRAADGWVGINCLTGQHWLDVCAMLGLPEYGEHQIAIMMGGPERDEFFRKAEPLLAQQTVAEIVELGQALRIPAAPVNDGATVFDCPQYAERGFFVTAEGRDWSFQRPGPAFRFSKTPVAQPRPAPRLGTRPEPWATDARSLSATDGPLPFSGLRVLDLTTFWAGAYLTCYLGAFGADIVKVESIQRPDGHRYSGAFAYEGDDWYERSPIWQGTNLNKRDLTLDLTSERGLDIARRLAAEADVVVENFSPRVVEQFGLDYDALASTEPRRDRRADAGIRPAGSVARLRRLGAELRADLGNVGGHRLPRRSAVQPAGSRRSDRRRARGGRAAGRPRASDPHRGGSVDRGRADRGGRLRDRRTGHRVLDDRRRAIRGRATGGAATCRVSTRPAPTECGWRCRCPTTDGSTTTCSTRWSPRGPAHRPPRRSWKPYAHRASRRST